MALSIVVTASCSGNEYRIVGDVTPFSDRGYAVDSVVLHMDGKTLAKAEQPKDSFVITGSVEQAEYAEVMLYLAKDGRQSPYTMPLALEAGEIRMNVMGGYFEGSPLNDAVGAFFTNLMLVSSVEQAEAALDTMIAVHAEDPAGVISLCAVAAALNPVKAQSYIGRLSERMQNTSPIVQMKEKYALKGKTAEGMPFVDFEAEWEGKTQRLSDYVGKGKYVLVDFWASWCGPCRMEIPNLIRVYNEYKGEKFEVIGVATWDKPRDTQKAIADMQIPYPQIMNAQKAGSDAYGIEGIPEIILFGPDGTILRRGLRGEQIEEAVKNVLPL